MPKYKCKLDGKIYEASDIRYAIHKFLNEVNKTEWETLIKMFGIEEIQEEPKPGEVWIDNEDNRVYLLCENRLPNNDGFVEIVLNDNHRCMGVEILLNKRKLIKKSDDQSIPDWLVLPEIK